MKAARCSEYGLVFINLYNQLMPLGRLIKALPGYQIHTHGRRHTS